MNFVLLEQYKNKQSNQKYKCTQKICVNDFKSKLNMHSTYVWTIKSNPHYNINVNLYNKIDFIFTVSVILWQLDLMMMVMIIDKGFEKDGYQYNDFKLGFVKVNIT